MIKITIDNKAIEVAPGTTILAAARSAGIAIPTLCYLESCGATGSCMVCAVRNLADGRMIPSCAARCVDGMNIVATSPDITQFRRGIIELLLNEHRGDCVAPCQQACPEGLDISTMLHLIVQGRREEAAALLFHYIPEPQKTCPACRGGCEMACRRGLFEEPVAIRDIISDLSIETPIEFNVLSEPEDSYMHRFGLATEDEMTVFIATKNAVDELGEAARCLRCDCRARNNCKLRDLASEYEAEQKHFGKSSIKFDRVYFGEVGYEVGKCVKCGNCISIGENMKPGFGPVFSDRGAAIRVTAPFGIDEKTIFEDISEECLKACPTGALFMKEDQ
jgi:predicted molibdopterin-dependent oxidoreductase YjgC